MLKVGDIAPNFYGENQDGKTISLKNFKGKKVILYFYSRDATTSSIDLACSLNDRYDYFVAHGFEVIGVGHDSINSHKRFSQSCNLEFNLVADTTKSIINTYDVWGEKKVKSKTSIGVLCTTYIISEVGVIEKIFSKVDVKSHAEQIIKSY